MAYTLAIAAVKGGTGKTTAAAALTQAATAEGLRVLAVDLDPQANLTSILSADANRPGVFELVSDDYEIHEVIQETEQGLSCIAASGNLATLSTKTGSAKRLATALDPIRDMYDLIVIDTPPTMGDLQNNALYIADGLIIPLRADRGSLQGLYKISDVARRMQTHNKRLKILGIIISEFDGRPKINRYMRDVLKDQAATLDIPFLTEIRKSVLVSEAQAMQQSLYSTAAGRKSKPGQDFRNLLGMIEARLQDEQGI